MTSRVNFASGLFLAWVFLAAPFASAAEIEVRGTILKPTREPLVGARVRLLPEVSPFEPARTSQAGETVPSAAAAGASDAEGRFRLVAPRAATYRVLIEAEGFMPVTSGTLALVGPADLAPVAPPVAGANTARAIDSTDGPIGRNWNTLQSAEERRFVRERSPGGISQGIAPADLPPAVGIVREASGQKPLQGALVWSPEEPGLWTITDRDGRYRLAVPPASRHLQALAAGFLPRRASLVEAELRSGRGPTFALRPAVDLAGKALDEKGGVLSEIAVSALPEGAPPGLSAAVAWGSSDPTGRFDLRGLTPGKAYRIQGSRAGFFGTPQTVIAPAAGAAALPIRLVLTPSQGIRGRVVDPAGKPILEAEILIRPSLPPKRSELEPIEPMRPDEKPYLAQTQAGGVFAIRDLPALEVDLIARKAGFAPVVVRGLQVRPGKAPQAIADVVLRPAVSLVGRVLDRAGRPIVGAAIHRVQRIEDLDRLEARLKERKSAAVSARDGGFVVPDLLAGTPTDFVVTAQGFAPAALRGVRAPTAEPVVVRLAPTEEFRGRVLDEEGAGIANAKIYLEWQGKLPENPRIRTGEQVARSATSDREGKFQIRNVPRGTADVLVSAAGFVASDHLEASLPQDAKVEWTAVLRRGSTLEGRVSTRKGGPIGGARVSAGSASGFSDDDGRYRVSGLARGKVEVEVYHSNYRRWTKTLEIESGDNTLDVQFEAGLRVTGVVLAETREPVFGAAVTLETVDQGRGRRAYRASTDAEGAFELADVADDDYRIAATAEGFAEEKPPGIVSIRGRDRDDLEVVLDRGASIVGRVLGLPQEELAWVEVSAVGEGPDAESGSVRVDAAGRYALRHLPLGNWQIRARHAQRQREVGARALLRSHGEEAVRDLRFGGGLKLSGVVDFGGEPLSGAQVSLRGQSRSIERSVTTDYRGEFQLDDLDADRYHLGVSERKTLALHNDEIVLDEDRRIEIHLRAGTVAGRVVNGASQAPIQGALLSLRPLVGTDFLFGGTSEEDGRFLLAKVPEGRYSLGTTADGFQGSTQEIEISGGSEAAGIEVKLAPTQGLDLVVALASGQPPALVHLRATGAGGGALAETRSVSADGRVRLATLPSGSWDLWLAAPGGASIHKSVEAPGEAVPVRLPPAGRVTVRVPDLAESSLIATTSLIGTDQKPLATLTYGGQISSTWPVKAGTAILEDVPAGSWTVVVQAPDGRTWTTPIITTGADGEIGLE